MTAATVSAPSIASTGTHAARLALVAVAVVALIAVAFVLGRVTSTTTTVHHTAPSSVVRTAPAHCGLPGVPC